MSQDIELTAQSKTRDRFPNDLPITTDDEFPPLHLNFNPAARYVWRKLLVALVFETIISSVVYYEYDKLLAVHALFAPALLGSATASLAQSMNQYSRRKFSLNKIYKFLLWGTINGILTNLWIDMLFAQIQSLHYRILIDQAIGAPSFQIIYNILSALWESGDLSNLMLPVHMRSLKYSYCFWPFFSTIAFVYLPKKAFFPANCLANLIWNLVLSKLT
jgi:hypothetical protein